MSESEVPDVLVQAASKVRDPVSGSTVWDAKMIGNARLDDQGRLRFDIVVEVGRRSGDIDDDVDRILSYDTLVAAIDRALADERLNLLETLAERIAALVLAEPMARDVVTVAANMMAGAAAITRARMLLVQGIDAGPAAEHWTPRPLADA
jgi:dihydroneopterin aldolase